MLLEGTEALEMNDDDALHSLKPVRVVYLVFIGSDRGGIRHNFQHCLI